MQRPRQRGLLYLLLLVLAAAPLLALPEQRELQRQDGKKWKRVVDVAKRTAKSAARHFLEERRQELQVPVEIDVFLIGFEGDGAYGYQLEANRLLQMLSSSLSFYCPRVWDTEEDLGVCFNVNFQVMGSSELPQAATLLRRLEEAMKAGMHKVHAAYDDQLESGQRAYYSMEASSLEHLFTDFLAATYPDDPDLTGPPSWHRHNSIFVINPSKVRMNPAGAPEDAAHTSPDFMRAWLDNKYDSSQLAAEEAGYVYRYAYAGAGESATWVSSRSFVVVDVSAGPSTYGPLVSHGGAVTRAALPSIKAVLSNIMAELTAVGPTLSAHEHAAAVAQHGQHAMFGGQLASTIMSAARHVFLPDMATQHIEWAKSILIPLVVLTDTAMSDDDFAKLSQENFFGINVTYIERALTHLLDPEQEAVVITAHHDIHKTPSISSALAKAARSHSEAVVDPREAPDFQGASVGMHVAQQVFIDPDALLEEIGEAADTLTHGLTSVAHMMGKEDEHRLGRLRHEGTRVVPVFVLSLAEYPDDVVLSNRELVAADHDAVVVLQTRNGARWGAPSEFYTGHNANGRRVTLDGSDAARHIISGLAKSLAGVVPPQTRYSASSKSLHHDWRWATGATPFGPYSNYSGVSEVMSAIARRNLLLSHSSAALKEVQEALDDLEGYAASHFGGPWEASGMREDKRHWLVEATGTVHAGYNASFHPQHILAMEGLLANLTTSLEGLGVDMFVHDFPSAQNILVNEMLPTAAEFCNMAEDALRGAMDAMKCCKLSRSTVVNRALVTVLACLAGAAVFFLLMVVALCARGQRKKALQALGLPTFGLPAYNGKSGTWSL